MSRIPAVSFFRSFSLFKYIFTARQQVKLMQVHPLGLEVPRLPKSLDNAIEISTGCNAAAAIIAEGPEGASG